MDVLQHDAMDVIKEGAKDVLKPWPGHDEDFIPALGMCLSKGLELISIPVLKSVVPLLGSGAGEAVDSHHSTAADLDRITLNQPMHSACLVGDQRQGVWHGVVREEVQEG